MYRNRDEDARKKMGRIIASATVAALSQQNKEALGQGQRNRDRGALRANQCARCKGFRHWKRECPRRGKGPRPRTVAELQNSK